VHPRRAKIVQHKILNFKIKKQQKRPKMILYSSSQGREEGPGPTATENGLGGPKTGTLAVAGGTAADDAATPPGNAATAGSVSGGVLVDVAGRSGPP
jgi:hypothetical protein